MELSELTTDESIASQPHQIFLPGCFVVLQGISGDGLANTIETSPEYSYYQGETEAGAGAGAGDDDDDDDDEVMQDAENATSTASSVASAVVEETKEAPPLEEDHFRRVVVSQQQQPQTQPGAATGGASSSNTRNPDASLLSQLVQSSSTTCALNNPVMNRSSSAAIAAAEAPPFQAVSEVQSDGSPPITHPANSNPPPEDSFIVIDDNDDNNNNNNNDTAEEQPNNNDNGTPLTPQIPTTNPTEDRNFRRKQQAVLQWNQDRMQQQRLQHQEWHIQQQQHQHQPSSLGGRPRQQQQQQHTDDWWWLDRETGYLAIFDCLPGSSSFNNQKRIGNLPPGSTVTANKLYTMDSESLKLIQTDGEEHHHHGDDAPPPPKPRPPSLAVIQLLEIQWNNNSTGSASASSTNSTTDQDQDQDPNLISDTPTVGYCAYSVHGYAFLVPGIANLYMNPQVWWWRVTCKVGAFLRQGLELSSDHQCTIPYGSFVQVTRKTVNRMGLSRLRVVANIGNQQKTGWCSEFLNPLSGQRGHVVQPLPFVVPAVYRVTLPEGAVIREDVELSSRQIGHAPCGTLLTIVQRKFSEHPQDQCVERLKLAGGRDSGWISVRLNQVPPQDRCVVELVDVDNRFRPNQPGDFHWQVFDEERIRQQEQAALTNNTTTPLNPNHLPGSNSTSAVGDLSSIDEDTSSDEKPKARSCNTNTGKSGSKKQQQVETCLICLTEERNATIVHGETGHIACCLVCARILKARGDRCPVCRLEIDSVIQHFWA